MLENEEEKVGDDSLYFVHVNRFLPVCFIKDAAQPVPTVLAKLVRFRHDICNICSLSSCQLTSSIQS